MRKFLAFFAMLMFIGILASAQEHTVKGHVTGPDGNPLLGITVQIKGSQSATATDTKGDFELTVPGDATLVFTGVGFAEQSLKVGNRTSINISLASSEQRLNEVVVTALGIKRDKRTLTYATQEVTGAALVNAKQDNLINALAGKVAGVQITNSSGMPGSSSQIVIRGNSTLFGDNTALIVVDGVPIDNSEAGNPDGPLSSGGTANRASDIDPNIIASITVLKGAAATALYGSAGSKGVVLITTKGGAGRTGSGKPSISFSTSYSFENAILPKFQDEYAQGLNGK